MEQKIKDRLNQLLFTSSFLGEKQLKALDWLAFLDAHEVEDFLLFIFDNVKSEAQETIESTDLGRVKEMAVVFSFLVKQYVKKGTPIFNDYQEIIRQLQFKAFYLIGFQDRYDFMSQSVVWALRKNLDLKAILEQYFFEWTGDSPANGFPELTALTRQLEQNEELISEPRLKLDLTDEKLAKPTVKNWLIKYKLQAGTRESALSIATFLTKFPPIRELTDEERNILEKILSIYFWLRNPLATVTERSAVETRRPAPPTPSTLGVGAVPAASSAPKPLTLLDDVIGKITRGELDKKKLAAYLKVVLPQPIDFKKVSGFVNELKRRGYPDFMEIVYFDPADGQYHWKE